MIAQKPVTLAIIIGAHGVTGEVRLKVFAQDMGAHARFNGGALTLRQFRDTPKGAIARFAEVADRNAAEALRGTELTVARESLPPLGEGEYYHADLLGLAVVSTGGAAVGFVVAVDNYGAGDVVEIERPATDGSPASRFMVPMTADAVPEWNGERMIVAADYVDQ